MISQLLHDSWQFQYNQDSKWKEAEVPGSIHLDLWNNNLIPDPFYSDNEETVQWVSKQDWDYRLFFSLDNNIIDKKNKILRFEGLDTFCDVFLNGNQILTSNNMFHPWEYDVTDLVNLEANELLLKFKSPLELMRSKIKNSDYELPADNDKAGGLSPYIRKAPYHFGWDWGPCLVTMGIWKKVELIGYDSFRTTLSTINQISCDDNAAMLEAEFHIESNSDYVGEVIIENKDSAFREKFEVTLNPGLNILLHKFKIFSPKLWWPKGYGNQDLYSFQISIKINEYTINLKKQIGIREISINTSKDKLGEKFEININGKPFFAKGANWIPADSFTTKISKKDYNSILDNAIFANFNTLRVWGGGIYEPDEFYQLCDEKGILVWQDFMFACSMYPGDQGFLDSVKKEITYQVKRLKHHPSIALWCGNNEIGVAWHNWGWKEKLPSSVWEKDYHELFHKLIPTIINKNDPSRFYWPTSPGFTTGLPHEGQNYHSGDNHYWGVWHGGDPFSAFKENTGRFMSEYGMQSFPNFETIKMFCPEDEFEKNSKSITAHQKASLGNKNLEKYLEMYFPEAKDFESFVILSQIMQSYALKTAIETHRTSMPKCMGTLYWQLNDCWPGISWSTLDYYGNWKASHYEVKRSFESLILTAIEKNNEITIYAVNDNETIHDLTLIIKIISLNGEILEEEKINISLLKHGSNQIGQISKEINLKNIDFIRLELISKDNCISRNDLFFTEPKNLILEKPSFNFNYKINNSKIHVQVNANNFLYKLHLSCKNQRGVFEDNFFEMLPNEQRIIEFYPNKSEGPLPSSYDFELKTFYELVKR